MYDMQKGGRRDALVINPQTAARLRACLEKTGHDGDSNEQPFRPLKHNSKSLELLAYSPDMIDRLVHNYAAALGFALRAILVTTVVEKGPAQGRAEGRQTRYRARQSGMTGVDMIPKAASFFATY